MNLGLFSRVPHILNHVAGDVHFSWLPNKVCSERQATMKPRGAKISQPFMQIKMARNVVAVARLFETSLALGKPIRNFQAVSKGG